MLIDRRQMIVGAATLAAGATAEGGTPDTKTPDRKTPDAKEGATALPHFLQDAGYFGSPRQAWMVNFRVSTNGK